MHSRGSGGLPAVSLEVIELMLLVTYDVNTENAEGRKRLRKVARCCVNYGQRVQNSVFECLVDNATYVKLKSQLVEMIDSEKDSLRFYRLGRNYHSKIEHVGCKESYDAEGFLSL